MSFNKEHRAAAKSFRSLSAALSLDIHSTTFSPDIAALSISLSLPVIANDVGQ